MRQFIIAAAMAVGLIAVWAALLPLTAEPAPKQAPPALSKALFLCRGANGIDQNCAAALAKAMVLDAKDDKAAAATPASARVCHMDRQVMASLVRQD